MHSNFAIPQNSWILVTGANGFIASNVINTLLGLGFRIRGTVREKKPWLDQYFDRQYGSGKFESIVIPAMEQDNAFQGAVKDVTGIVHVVCTPGKNTNQLGAQQIYRHPI